jgi:DNA-directed RNA polymerase specialized sigma24 family protein
MGTFTGKHAFDESWLRAAENGSLPIVASQDSRFAAILALPDFERFVYVLTVLEGCTDQQCATLLGVPQQQIEEARLRALRHFWKRD